MQGPYWRKYGVETTIVFHLYQITGTELKVDAAHASGDTKIMKDEGDEANTTNAFTDEGQGYSIVLTATEMQAARVVVHVVDQGTKEWIDTSIIIETYGHASAMHAVDLDDSVRMGLTSLPNAAADAAGGLPISDAGALDLDSKLANTNEITAARMGALTDWINGGRLDLILDSIVDYVDSLESRLTDARAGYLDELGSANIPADIDTLISRLTSARAGYLDNLSAGAAALQSSVDDLEGRLTATRAGYLDYINTIYSKLPSKSYLTGSNNADGDIQADEATGNFAGSVGSVAGNISGTVPDSSGVTTLLTRITAAVALNSDMATLLARLSSDRAGYLDNLSGGAVALASALSAVAEYVDTEVSSILTIAQKIDTALELDGAVYRFTVNALENSPTGSGGFTSDDRTKLEGVYNKLPSKSYLTGSANSDGDIEINDATGTPADSSGITTLLSRITDAVALNSDMATLLSRIVGTLASGTHNPQSGDSYAVVNSGTYGNSALKTLIDAIGVIVDAIKTVTDVIPDSGAMTTIDGIVDAIQVVTDRLSEMLELDVDVYRFTENALENSPVGTGGFTSSDRSVLEAIYSDTGTDGVKISDPETGLTFPHAIQAIFALVCKMAGGGSTSITARNYADTKNRITWTVDENGNRTAVTFNFD